MKELMPVSLHPSVRGVSMDEMIDRVNRSFVPEQKADMRYLRQMEAQYGGETYTRGFGLYAQAVRAYVEKWRVPDEEQQVGMINSFELTHP